MQTRSVRSSHNFPLPDAISPETIFESERQWHRMWTIRFSSLQIPNLL